MEKALPFPDESFDLILNINSLHMVSRPEIVLVEFRRLLRSGGTLIMSHPQKQPSILAILAEQKKSHGFRAMIPLLFRLSVLGYLMLLSP
jgi:ubiquinone/menaquinone biosynthesis C-methylase UbiE